MADAQVCEASVRDLSPLIPLLQQEARCAREFARYYDLRTDFDWHAYAIRKLKSKRRKVFIAKTPDAVAGFVEVRVTGYPHRSAGPLTRLKERMGWNRYVPIEPLTWGVIEGCFVEDRFRRGGVGRSLVSAAVAWLKSEGIERVELGVLADNKTALAFWDALGFRSFRILMSKSV